MKVELNCLEEQRKQTGQADKEERGIVENMFK